MKAKKRFRFTQQQVDFIIDNYKNMEVTDLVQAFNQEFGTKQTKHQIKNKIFQLKISKRNVKKSYGKYSEEMIEWLLRHHNKTKLDDLVTKFNSKFNTDFTKSAIWHKIDRSRGAEYQRNKEYVPRVKWTKDLENFIEQNYEDYKYKDLSKLMNKKFGIKTTALSVEHKVYRLGLKKNKEARMKTFNYDAVIKTGFKKGRIPETKKKLGYERVAPDGYVWVKISEPDVFKQKHKVVWEKANGKIPEDHCIIFLDGDKQNCHLDNLKLISRADLAVLNFQMPPKTDADLTKTSLVLVKLIRKINERSKKNGEK